MLKSITYILVFSILSLGSIFAQPKPENGLSGVSILPYFEWTASGSYYLQISTSDDFSTDFMEVNVNALTSYQVTEAGFDALGYSPLNNNTKYYWRIADGSGAGAGSVEPAADPYFFTTVADVNITLSNPSDGADVYPFDPTQFSWFLGSSVGSLKFLLQIEESTSAPSASDWTSADFEEDDIGSTSESINGLSGGTTYFWRVIVYYDDGSTPDSYDVDDRVVKFSAVFHFDTQGGAVKAYPSWPVGGNTIYNLKPTYYWYSLQYDAGAAFEVYVVKDGSNGNDASKLDDDGATPLSAGSDTFVEEDADLDPSTTYLWQVKTTNGSDTEYSDIAEFTTYDAPGATATEPTLSYPVGGVKIYTTSPTLYWYIEGTNSGSFYFEIELSDDGGLNWSTYPTTTDTYLQVSGLTPGTDYKWKVTHTDGSSSEPSDEGEFTVAGGMNSTIVLSWPTGNPTLYTANPALSWYVEGSTLGWDKFIVKWNKDSAPGDWSNATTGSYTTSDINETHYQISTDLEYGSTYHWAVALDTDPTSSPVHGDYAASSFTIAGGSATVELTSPANNSVINTKSPTFYWYVSGSGLGIDKYKVTYSNTETFTANVVELESVTTNAAVTSDLQEGSIYWWYVSVSYDNGSTYSAASPTWEFTVDAGASAVMPLVGSPVNGVSVNDSELMLSWYITTGSDSELTYEVEIADNADFNNSSIIDNLSELHAQVNGLDDGEYYWRVRSSNGNNTSNYSNVGNFKVGGVTGVEENDETPLTFVLDQNYPNPFNPATIINYSLPAPEFVTIKIYDMLGREVSTLVNEKMNAGNHKVNWNGTDYSGRKVASGTYIYRFKAGNFVDSKKMLLIK